MTTLNADAAQAAPYRSLRLPVRRTLVDRRPDGTLIMRSASVPVAIEQSGFTDFVCKWAESRGDTPAFCERDTETTWRTITWRELWHQLQAVAAALLEIGLGQGRPLLLLSGNSIEQAVLLLAAEYVGIPTMPVSPAYSTLSKDLGRLRAIVDLIPPAAVFVQSVAPFENAVAALNRSDRKVIAVQGASGEQVAWNRLVDTALTPARRVALDRAHAAIRPVDVMRVLFTSGSTGAPKGVTMTYANLQSSTAYFHDSFEALAEPQPVFLDWMPWHHTMGGVFAFGRAMVTGATHYIDDGRPVRGQFQRTVRNLHDVSPTVFSSAPSALAMLATELENDVALAAKLFSRLVAFGYGGASLPGDVWERIQRVAEQTVGERIAFCTSLGATETNGTGTYLGWASDDLGNIGVATPGTDVKLVPLDGHDGRYEIRLRGGSIFTGYVARPDLTADAFDDEGYFRLGDAVRLVEPGDPSRGLRFAGRVVEDFKLTNGTWVRTGSVRLALLELCAPLLTDAVICGHDHDFIAALAWPNVAACQRLAPELAELDAAALTQHPIVVAQLQARLRTQTAKGASLKIERLMLMAEPPSIDANEIADKGYVNQATTRARRANLIDELYLARPSAHIACA